MEIDEEYVEGIREEINKSELSRCINFLGKLIEKKYIIFWSEGQATRVEEALRTLKWLRDLF